MRQTLYLICAILMMVFFLMPWFFVDSPGASLVSQVLDKTKIPTISITGLDIPVMANGKDAKLILKIARIFKPDIQSVDKWSLLVYLVPGLTLLALLSSFIWKKNKTVHWIWAVIGIGLAAGIYFNLHQINQNKIVLRVVAGPGFLGTIATFLLLGLAGIYSAVKK